MTILYHDATPFVTFLNIWKTFGIEIAQNDNQFLCGSSSVRREYPAGVNPRYPSVPAGIYFSENGNE